MRNVTQRPEWLDGLEVGAFDPSGMKEVLGVLSRGMRDNPLHVAAFGHDPGIRQRRFRALLSAAFAHRDLLHTLVARGKDGAVVGVCGMTPPGACQPGLVQQIRFVPILLRLGPRVAGRVVRWMGVWKRHDPKGRHWHVGPLAVDAHLQGRGVGGRLMRVFCARMDAAGDDAYLETDKPINVRFFEHFGFVVIGEEKVLGVTNYFMHRKGRVRQP